ncbi:sensor histidine kinase [Rhodohalobacter sp. 8-1]|uniref:sensor histidine kinase n=1 Tax=Rhodohalobacter sp. 8-1 TaxID=3131972 RepID=UPI0030EC3A69
MFTPKQASGEQSGLEIQEDQKDYFLYDSSRDSFNKFPKTEEAVDSLLSIGFDFLNKDSGISFRAARQAETLADEIQYETGLAGVYNLLGSNYLDFGDHEMANTYYLKALRIEEELGNERGIASALNNLSLIYVEQEDYETAAKYLEESIEAWKSLDDEQESLISTNNLGVIHRRQGNYEKALDYFWETSKRAILRTDPDSLSYIIATLNIGNTYRNMDDFKRAKIHLDTALDYLKRHEQSNHMIFTYIVLGNLYNDINQPEKAINYTTKGLQLAESEGMREKTKEAHQLLATIYEGLDNYALAFHHFQLFHEHSDTLQSMQRGEKISELQSRFDVEQKDREIEILNKEAELREANLMKMDQLRSFLIAGVIVLFIIIALLYSSNRTRKRNNRNLEEKQRQIEENNKKLSALNAEKDEFMSIAAHDLRNPLSSINLAVDMINSEEQLDQQTVREYTELIKISSSRMITLINDVLKIHTIDAYDKTESGAVLEINSLVEESLLHFREPARTKNIQIKSVLNRTLDPLIGDSDNVLRIMDNLISNAIKYSPCNTSVIISTKQAGSNVQITIRDQGPGISPADQKKLFSKFSKLSNKPTGNESSTGLGLYIVKKICTTMNGSVRCESEPGCGATFIVELPTSKNNRASLNKPIRRKKRTAG